MRDYRDAKAMAQTLRQALKERSTSITHSESLELIARTFGVADWNTLSAAINASPKAVTPAVQAVRRPAMPLRDLVLFPGMTSPIFAMRLKSLAAIEQAMSGDKEIFFVTQRRAADDDPGGDDLYTLGVVAKVIESLKLPDGSVKMMVHGVRRARVERFDSEGGGLVAELAAVEREGAAREEAATVSRELLRRFEAHANINLEAPPQALMLLPHLQDGGSIADMIAQYLSLSVEQRQQILEEADVIRRMQMILAILTQERQAA